MEITEEMRDRINKKRQEDRIISRNAEELDYFRLKCYQANMCPVCGSELWRIFSWNIFERVHVCKKEKLHFKYIDTPLI